MQKSSFMLSADFNLMESQGWGDTNPGTCSLAFSANHFWILMILADNLVGCPNQPHIFIAFFWGTPIFSIGLHTYTGEIKRPRALPVDMQAIHFCWNLRIPIMWEKTHLSRLVIQKGSRKNRLPRIIFQGLSCWFCWCFFFLIWRFFPKSGALGDLTESQPKLTKIFRRIGVVFGWTIPPTFTLLSPYHTYMNLMYTFTFFSETICWDVLGSLLFTQKHLVGYLKVSLTQKNCVLYLGAILFVTVVSARTQLARASCAAGCSHRIPSCGGCCGRGCCVQGWREWTPELFFLGRSRTTGDHHFIKLGMNTATLALGYARFDKPKKLSLHSGKLT